MSTLFSFGFKKDGSKSSTKKRPLASTSKASQDTPIADASPAVEVSGHLTKKARLEPPKPAEKTPVAVKKKLVKPRSRKKKVIDSDSDEDYSPDSNDEEEDADDSSENPVQSKSTFTKTKAKSESFKTPKSRSGSVMKTSSRSVLTPVHSIRSTSTPVSQRSSQKKLGVLEYGEHEHHHLFWLTQEKMKDSASRSTDHAEYDPRTLFVPNGYLSGEPKFHSSAMKPRKITPAMRIWWGFKKEFYDCVLFFKVGKFYELYHMDADVGVSHLKMLYMKGDVAHAGFPEISYGKFSEVLVSLGYRVARVEQTETPAAMRERTGKSSGCVRREVCSVLSAGTRTLSFRDGRSARTNEKVQLCCLWEAEEQGGDVIIGICLCDPTTGKFRLNQFKDGSNRLVLRSILAREKIAEVAFEKRGLSKSTQEVLRHMLPFVLGQKGTCLYTEIPQSSSKGETAETATNALETITSPDKGYFVNGADMPEVLKEMRGASKEHAHSLAALDVCLRVLIRAGIDHELISLRDFNTFVIPGVEEPSGEASDAQVGSKLAVMDGQALENLQILDAGNSSSPLDSVFGFLNKCTTAFGKRELKSLVCAPLFQRTEILTQQAKVTAIVAMLEDSVGMDVISTGRRTLSKVPDLERLLSRIHALGLQKQSSHPDSRAVLYENDKYNKWKIGSLHAMLGGMKDAIEVLQLLGNFLSNNPGKFDALGSLVNQSVLDEVEKALEHFESTVDLSQAKSSGIVKPKKGLVEDYDAALFKISELKRLLNEELEKERKEVKCRNPSSITFWHPASGKDIYQIQVPDAALPPSKDAPSHWRFMSKRKGVRRFHTLAIVKLLKQYEQAELELEQCERDATRGVFEKFDAHRGQFMNVIDAVKQLDCLLSLGLVSAESSEDSPMCIPEILDESSAPVIRLEASRHPCVALGLERQGKDFIPNDLSLGENGKCCMILTGPNMGGKSTLLRQACVATVLAQIGCYVPAKSCSLTPVDRIFTRIGASDRILSGQSTFFVELDETATILKHATKNSLVILDELGRGTSTFDGAAIAFAVTEKLCEKQMSCRTLFATHYHALVKEFQASDKVALGHMACFADKDKAVDRVTFLYKLASGPCDKSHGLNVARLAHIAEDILAEAHVKSEEFEVVLEMKKILASGKMDPAKVKSLWERAQTLVQ